MFFALLSQKVQPSKAQSASKNRPRLTMYKQTRQINLPMVQQSNTVCVCDGDPQSLIYVWSITGSRKVCYCLYCYLTCLNYQLVAAQVILW